MPHPSAPQRNFRSRLSQLVHQALFLRGTLSVRSRPCGKPNCRCVRGQLHASLYLVQSQGGKLRQLAIPRAWEDRVREAVHNYQRMQELIEEISELEWKQLRKDKAR
jgi:hypothetical protein